MVFDWQSTRRELQTAMEIKKRTWYYWSVCCRVKRAFHRQMPTQMDMAVVPFKKNKTLVKTKQGDRIGSEE